MIQGGDEIFPPLSVLAAGAIYDVSFSGMVGAIPVVKTWSFTTKS